MSRKELLKSKEYWLVQIQNDIFNLIENYRREKELNQTGIADYLGVTKGYVSQILHGDYDHKISKLIELALAFNKVPVISFIDLNRYIEDDAKSSHGLIGNYTYCERGTTKHPTHSGDTAVYSKEDMIGFAEWINNRIEYFDKGDTDKWLMAKPGYIYETTEQLLTEFINSKKEVK